ncbi:DNA-binding response regulator [Oleomonas cavernae]|uniref:DNA-binding response regulator n=1 Tax=Oleomonas cavernae TaxID=2320859 RepID=A0A418VTQ8_9PROT|nr:response regulator transcription factor [Oleomonas cavernae]RJF80532.1 DNA-binding response regulator [Oleomonas cavernae]
MTLLLIEDDRMLGKAIADGLRPRFQVEWVKTVADAEAALATDGFDLAVLDLGLPDGSGLDLLKRERRQGNKLPVLILTARDAIQDRLAGLNTGADDYLTKPFDLNELIARCEAILRRAQGRASPLIEQGDLVYEPAARTASLAGEPLHLSARELAVLDILLANRGRVVSKNQIEERLYSADEVAESNTVEVHVSHLRRKIGRDRIRTVRGLGYMMPKRP